MNRQASRAVYEKLKERLEHETSRHIPFRILLAHGWTPGPGLPHSLLVSGLFEIEEIPSGGISSIITNFWGMVLILSIIGTRYVYAWGYIPTHESNTVLYILIGV